MYTDSFPISKTLNISFSEIFFAKKIKDINTISCNVNLRIDLDDKFINRSFETYNSDNNIVEKAIVTETGFYAIINVKKFKTPEIYLIDENNTKYNCYSNMITANNESDEFKDIVISDFKNTEDHTVKLIIDNDEIILNKG